MTTEASYPEKPWQDNLVGSKSKLNALFNDGYISDLIITFPGKEIKYKAHKVIMAMSSSIFERMLFGPMAITGSVLELPGDNPEAFKIVLAYCYEVDIVPSDIDEALKIYILADKYLLEELRKKSLHYICRMFSSENIEKVLEFSNHYNFESLEEKCYKYLMNKHERLLDLNQVWLRKVLESPRNIPELVFEDTWKDPEKPLQDDTIIQILKSENCRNKGLRKFSGCVSAKVVSNICWDGSIEEGTNPELNLSFNNLQQANQILSLLDTLKYKNWLSLHFHCNLIPADRLSKIPASVYQSDERPDLYLSNVDDGGIDWVLSAIHSLKPMDQSFGIISFTSSELTLSGFMRLLKKMAIVFADVRYPDINIVSSNIPSDKQYHLREWIELNIMKNNEVICMEVYDENYEIDGWLQNLSYSLIS